jgi:hypothetical protein
MAEPKFAQVLGWKEELLLCLLQVDEIPSQPIQGQKESLWTTAHS